MYILPLILLGIIAVAIIIVPYFLKAKNDDGEAPDVGVYKAQLKELQLDVKRGVISTEDEEKSRLEIGRRLLKAAGQEPAHITREPVNYILLAIMTLIIAGSVMLYGKLGNPNMPDFPKKAAQLSASEKEENQKNIDLIKQVNAALNKIPDDARGWAYLANLQMNMKNFQEASSALYQAHLLEPDMFDYQLMYGESLIMAANERVSPAANLILNKALLIQPDHPGVKYYLALGEFQAGEIEKAYATWTVINEGIAADNPLKPLLQFWIAKAEQELGIGLPTTRAPSFSPQQAEIIQNMDADQQQELIAQMVMQLADKMKQNPGNIEGWLRLSRAYMVLGKNGDAINAMKAALENAPQGQRVLLQKELEKLINIE